MIEPQSMAFNLDSTGGDAAANAPALVEERRGHPCAGQSSRNLQARKPRSDNGDMGLSHGESSLNEVGLEV